MFNHKCHIYITYRIVAKLILTRRKMDIQDKYLVIQLYDKHLTYSVLISKYSAVIFKIFVHEKNSSIKFIELCKSSEYRHLLNKVLENLQNFSESGVELSIIFPECSAFYSEKFCNFYKTLFCKCLYSQLLNSSINSIELFYFVCT